MGKKWSVAHYLFGRPAAAGVNLCFVRWRWYFFWIQALNCAVSWYEGGKPPLALLGILFLYGVTQVGLWKLSAPRMRGVRAYMVLLTLELAFYMYIAWWFLPDSARNGAVAAVAVTAVSVVTLRRHAIILGFFAAVVVLLGVDQRALSYADFASAVMVFYLADYAGMLVFEAQAEYRINEMIAHEEISAGFLKKEDHH